jgi:FtsH-binding integral membrane protein
VTCLFSAIRTWMHAHIWTVIVAILVNLCMIYALGCYHSLARKMPINFILLAIFTVTEAYMISFISSVYSPQTVFIAAALTAGVVVALTVYACWTKTDFTIYGGLLFICLFVFVIVSMLAMFFQSRWITLVISSIGVILFGIYLIYDTQLVMGGKRVQLGIDDYIIGSIMLYLDIMNIFVYLLAIVGGK